MDDQPATITLIGRSSAWGIRVSASQPRPWSQGAPHDPGRVMMAWLHHRSYGTLGVYLREPPGDRRRFPPARQWLQVRGAVQPWRVHAQPDDPRSAAAPELTSLAIVASEIALISIADAAPLAPPLLPHPQHVRLLAGRRCGCGYLAPVAQQSDVSYWQAMGMLPPAIISWNRIVGVVSALGPTRYLRYVLSTSAGHHERM
ncbi:MAG: hypothetical protein WCF99_01475 [Chloroflexales bacterium]